MTESFQLKEEINQAAISQLGQLLQRVYPSFAATAFEKKAMQGLAPLELKARVQHLIATLAMYLPQDFDNAARILEKLPAVWPVEPERNWSSFIAWPVIDYVAVYGLEQPERALPLLKKLTGLFTAEFAIRPFLLKHFDLTYLYLLQWAEDENEAVRRLASEGIRPRLPWAPQLPALKHDPSPLWPILNKLKADDSLYVRRSVANNLNDISKDHADQVIAVCEQWHETANAQTQWVIRHGLRTLVKTGHKAVYPLLGFSDTVSLQQVTLTTDKIVVQLGEKVTLRLAMQTAESCRLVVDYRIGYMRANGKPGYKVFKWKNCDFEAGTELTLTKRHAFKPISTRRFYPGKHIIECLVNGEIVARTEVTLTV